MMFTYEHIHTADEELTKRAADYIRNVITDAIGKRGKCTIGLSGGTTPGPIYAMLAASPHSPPDRMVVRAGDSLPPFDSAQGKLGERMIDWSKVSLFLVDERYVAADDPQSNQRMVRETLLKEMLRDAPPADSAPQHDTAGLHSVFPNTTLLIEECAKDYEEQLRNLLPDQEIDLVILGLGEDGHIASLFPGDVNALLERERWVLPTETEKFAVHNRVTVTLPLLEKARKMLFLLKGDGKKKIFAEVISANVDPIEYPAHALLQTGRTVWITGW
jgi:6-phosphogluconolactonase